MAEQTSNKPASADSQPWVKRSGLYRRLQRVRGYGIVSRGFNITFQRHIERVSALIAKLQPQDTGRNLIRIGGAGDGGYLVPDDLEGIQYCFSPGVATTSDFENDLADRGIHSFLADYSVEKPPILRPEFTFDKRYLGATDTPPFITLASWKEKYLGGYNGDLILQMDIEGSEYPVLFNTPDSLLRQFRIIVIEFHQLQKLFDPFVFELFSACFEKLLQSFCVVHIHPNNGTNVARRGSLEIPIYMEFTFLNRSRVSTLEPIRSFPHKLDARNDPAEKDLVLPKCWYAGGQTR